MDELKPEMTVAEVNRRIHQFYDWNGDPPAPQFTHWTPVGTMIMRVSTPLFTCAVIWRPKDGGERILGYGSIHVVHVAQLVARGEYDRDLGFPASNLNIPANVIDWNNL